MNNSFKIIIGVIVVVILYFVIDVGSVLMFSKPVFAVKEDNGDSVNLVYRGLFYDVYNCADHSMAMIKSKGTKYACSVGEAKVVELVDKTKDINDFACAEVMESFYEDDEYIYFWSCLKGSYMVVRYSNGYEEPIGDALKKGTIKISDLDEYDISYYKDRK